MRGSAAAGTPAGVLADGRARVRSDHQSVVSSTAIAGPTVTKPPRSPSSPSASAGQSPSLDGDRRNQWAFAPLDDPSEVTVEGRVSQTQAWSTSKVLVVAAYLDTAVDGNPSRVSRSNRQLNRLAALLHERLEDERRDR